MEIISDQMEKSVSNWGGKLRSYKVFKKLDWDADGFLSLKDLEDATRHLKLWCNWSDIHWLMSELDEENKGSIDV